MEIKKKLIELKSWEYKSMISFVHEFSKRKSSSAMTLRLFTRYTVITMELAGGPGGGGVLAYMGHTGMCRCEGYGFQAVYSSIGYINQSIWV